MWRERARWKAPNGAVDRSTSAMSVPRPGPASTRWRRSGRPRDSQHATHQTPMSSPKTWLISGEVTKSPR